MAQSAVNPGIAAISAAIAAQRARMRADDTPDVTGEDYETWLRKFFPGALSLNGVPIPFAPHHHDHWKWVWGLKPGVHPIAQTNIWSRGAAKSTLAELSVPAIFARKARWYGLYVCETQDRADDHVQNIAALLESQTFGEAYPLLSSRKLSKFGAVKGWRRNRLVTAQGQVLDALGLDNAVRGIKFESQRPDLIIGDDLDGKEDSELETARKIRTLTGAIFGAGSADCAVLLIQNLIHDNSIFSQLVDGRADFLLDRQISGPYPALLNFTAEQREGKWVIISGEPTWEGQNVEACQNLMNRIGYSNFMQECQHEVGARPGGMFSHLSYQHVQDHELPRFVRTCCWVDPAVTDTDRSDSHGVQVGGVDSHGVVYKLFSWESRATPLEAIRLAIRKAIEWHCPYVGIETDQGGDTWQSVYREAWAAEVGEHAPITIPMRGEKAGAGHGPKEHRAQQMLVDYERGKVVHLIGTHDVLERALFRFPLTKPLDLVDVSYWVWADLTGHVRSWWGWQHYVEKQLAAIQQEAANLTAGRSN